MSKDDFSYDDEFRKGIASIAESMSERPGDWLARLEVILPKSPRQMRESKLPPYFFGVVGIFTFSKDDSGPDKVKIVCPMLKAIMFGREGLNKFKLSGKFSSDKLRPEKNEVSIKLAGGLHWPRGCQTSDMEVKLTLTFEEGEFGERSNAILETTESMSVDTTVPQLSVISAEGNFVKRCHSEVRGTMTLITDELGPEIR